MFIKYTQAILLILFCHQVLSQDTIYYDKERNKILPSEKVETIEIIHLDTFTQSAIVQTFYSDFNPKAIDHYATYSPDNKIREGISKSWDRNGTLRSEITYIQGVYSVVKTYWPNGKIRREDKLEEGVLTKGNCFDSLGNEVKYYEYEQMPEFPGGVNALMKFISRNVKYPREAIRRGEEGKVYLNFIIDEDGQTQNVKVIKGVSELIDSEALRVLEKMPRWSPGRQDGELVKVRYAIPIEFKTNMSEKEKTRSKKRFTGS